MTRSVKAPEGYEGQVVWVDRAGWNAYARPAGALWWTSCGGPWGHAQMQDADVDARAEGFIASYVRHGMVK